MLYLRVCHRPTAAEVDAALARDAARGGDDYDPLDVCMSEEEWLDHHLSEYPLHWVRFFGRNALDSPVRSEVAILMDGLPARLASGAHPWAPELLKQMHSGARKAT